MVRRQQDLTVWHREARAVLERIRSLARKHASALKVVKVGFESDPAQRHNHPDLLEAVHLAVEIRRAVGQLLRKRLVIGWGTADRGGDVEIPQLKAILAIGSVGLIREPRLIQNWIHEFAGGVTGERASGTV